MPSSTIWTLIYLNSDLSFYLAETLRSPNIFCTPTGSIHITNKRCDNETSRIGESLPPLNYFSH